MTVFGSFHDFDNEDTDTHPYAEKFNMSSIIIQPAFEGPHPLATSAPGALAINEACRQFDMAQQAVAAYVDGKRRGHPIECQVWRKAVALIGFGEPWRNASGDGQGTVHVPYGDWAQLDRRIEEAIAHYTAVAS